MSPVVADRSFLDDEFRELYARFVSEGGLETTHVPHEDWERRQRQQVYCVHDRPKASCPHCGQNPKAFTYDSRGEDR